MKKLLLPLLVLALLASCTSQKMLDKEAAAAVKYEGQMVCKKLEPTLQYLVLDVYRKNRKVKVKVTDDTNVIQYFQLDEIKLVDPQDPTPQASDEKSDAKKAALWDKHKAEQKQKQKQQSRDPFELYDKDDDDNNPFN